jgi:hypothetical protein
MRRSLLCGIALALALCGCSTVSGGHGERVDEVHLFGLPVTFNLDAKPGPDGFAVRVFVTKGGGAKGSEIKAGTLDVLMFDGTAGAGELATKQPMQVWHFSPRQLAALREQSSLGTGYRFALRWKEAPSRSYFTVAARYVPVEGEPVYSAPSTITTTAR